MSTDHVKIQVRKGTKGGSPGCLSYPAHGGAESGGTILSAKVHTKRQVARQDARAAQMWSGHSPNFAGACFCSI